MINNQGLLTQVSAGDLTYGMLSYHPNLLVSQITHGNGMVETQSNDPNDMRRPAALAASGPYASPEAANAPESAKAKMIPSDGPARALEGAAEGAAVAIAGKSAIKALGLGGDRAGEMETKGSQEVINEESGIDEGESRDFDTRGLERQLAAHEQKLEVYRKNPEAHDNKEFLKNAPSEEARKRIVEGRIKSLERQIA
jgi:hypothetical protein